MRRTDSADLEHRPLHGTDGSSPPSISVTVSGAPGRGKVGLPRRIGGRLAKAGRNEAEPAAVEVGRALDIGHQDHQPLRQHQAAKASSRRP